MTYLIFCRVKFEESDNPLVRSARMLTDKVQDIFGSVLKSTELSEVLTEIVKMDPNFDKEQFLKDCETDFIPNILEVSVSSFPKLFVRRVVSAGIAPKISFSSLYALLGEFFKKDWWLRPCL